MKSDDIRLSYQMLYNFNKILDENDIKYFLIGKTLLTIVKYKGIIPEKNNVSVGIFKEDIGKILNISELFKKCEYSFKKTTKGYKVSKNNISLILTIFKPYKKKYTIDNPLAKNDFPIKSYILKKNLSPIKKLKIGEFKVSVIKNYIPYLTRNYPNYNNTKEKVVKPPKIRKSNCMVEKHLTKNEIMKKIHIEKLDNNSKSENKNCMSVYDNKKVISFYVNCDVHKKRKEKFLKYLKAAKGVKSCRESCVNGKAITRKLVCQMIDYRLVDKKADINPIEIAIFLSHYNIWVKLLNSNAEYALVFEDDGEIHPNFKSMLDKTLKKLRENNKKFDILFLWNGNWNKTLKYAKKVLKIDKDITVIRETTEFTPGTVSYLITRKFAKKLVQNSFPIKNSVDIYMGTQPFVGKDSIPLSIKMTHDKKRECYLSPFFRGKDWICGGDWGTGDTTQNYDSEQILEIDCGRLKNGKSTILDSDNFKVELTKDTVYNLIKDDLDNKIKKLIKNCLTPVTEMKRKQAERIWDSYLKRYNNSSTNKTWEEFSEKIINPNTVAWNELDHFGKYWNKIYILKIFDKGKIYKFGLFSLGIQLYKQNIEKNYKDKGISCKRLGLGSLIMNILRTKFNYFIIKNIIDPNIYYFWEKQPNSIKNFNFGKGKELIELLEKARESLIKEGNNSISEYLVPHINEDTAEGISFILERN